MCQTCRNNVRTVPEPHASCRYMSDRSLAGENHDESSIAVAATPEQFRGMLASGLCLTQLLPFMPCNSTHRGRRMANVDPFFRLIRLLLAVQAVLH